MKRVHAVAVAVALVLSAPALDGYLKLGTRVGGNLIPLRWTAFPIRYFITNRDIPGVSAPQLQQAVSSALATWSAVPNVSVSSQFVGFTGASPASGDGMTVIGFQNRPDLDRVLGSTSFTIDGVSGDVIESDIFLNSQFAWSVASGGEAGRQDVESIALHELGHLLGLGHSALGETELFGGGRRVLGAESVMFPIAFSAGNLNRGLRADDVAGLSDIYGSDAFRTSTGSITGRVTKSGSGVLGAHVVAFNPASGKMIGGFSLTADGSFTIGGLEPGLHVVRAEPLDDGDAGSFIDVSQPLDLDFKPAIYGRLVSVPRGGTASGVEVKVAAR
jgi:Matrixin